MAEQLVSRERIAQSEEAARIILRLNAVRVLTEGSINWSSGIKSPVYSDMRLILSDPDSRSSIADMLSQRVVSLGNVDAVSGTSTGGIAHATLVSDRLHLPMTYVRSESKKHGTEQRVEGKVQPGQRIAVIEDLISTGGSSISSVDALREKEAICDDVLSIFTYKLSEAEKNSQMAGINFDSLTDFPTVMRVAVNNRLWSTEQIGVAQEWYSDPHTWENR